MTRGILIGLVVLSSALAVGQLSPDSSRNAAATHPLDPLSSAEIRTAIQTVRTDQRLSTAAFPSIALLDPPKADVLAWRPGQPLARQARVQAMTADRVYEVTVDLGSRRLG